MGDPMDLYIFIPCVCEIIAKRRTKVGHAQVLNYNRNTQNISAMTLQTWGSAMVYFIAKLERPSKAMQCTTFRFRSTT